MQFIESTPWAVKSARLSFQNLKTERSVTLFPMLHVGEVSYFQRVYDDAFAHDVVLVEGIHSPIVARLVRSYTWIRHSKSLNLVIQPPYPAANPRQTVVPSDLSAEEFAELWNTVPLSHRYMAALLVPLLGLHRRFFANRASLGKGLTLDSEPTAEEYLNFEETLPFNEVIMVQRDRRLIEHLEEQLSTTAPPLSIAVLYGAAHMRSLTKMLVANGFVPTGSEWNTVFTL